MTAVRLVINEKIYARLAELLETDIYSVKEVPQFAAADRLRDAGEDIMAETVMRNW